MTDIPRWHFGVHPLNGDRGAWLSKPGINVKTTVDPNNMLICPTIKNEQILMRGSVGVPGPGGINVFFPVVLPSPPMVFFWFSVGGGVAYYPFGPDGSLWSYGEVTAVWSYTDHMLISNSFGSRVVHFIVASRGIP